MKYVTESCRSATQLCDAYMRRESGSENFRTYIKPKLHLQNYCDIICK